MPMKFFQKKVGGKYQLGKTIGRGHFSKVKDAVHVKTKIRFAVKAVDKKVLQEEQMEEQLKREIALMRRLNHPSIVRLYEVFTTKTTIYLVLELVLGGELFNRIVEEKRFSEDVARTYFQQLLIGTYYCHCHGIAHRDLKPENLLLDQQNHLKITDFGLSTLQPNYKGTVMHGMELKTMCGSPEYVAPEILQGSGYSGFTADVWACGVILYVMISGSLPFVDTDVDDV